VNATEARDAVAAAVAAVDSWSVEVTTREAELADLDERSGTDAIASGPEGLARIGAERSRILSEADVARRALAVAQARVVDAKRAHLHALRADVLAMAEDLEREASDRETITTELRRQLQEHEGAPFFTDRPTRTSDLRDDAKKLRTKAEKVKAVAERPDLTDQVYESGLNLCGDATPEGRARKAHAQAVRAWGVEVRDLVNTARMAWIADRGAELVRTKHPDLGVMGEPSPENTQLHKEYVERRAEIVQRVAGSHFDLHRSGWTEGPYAGRFEDRALNANLHALSAVGIEVDLPPEPKLEDFLAEATAQ
jgi:hypothetical protein